MKIIIKSIEKIDNGYLCIYSTLVNRNGTLFEREYKQYANTPLKLSRLLISACEDEVNK